MCRFFFFFFIDNDCLLLYTHGLEDLSGEALPVFLISERRNCGECWEIYKKNDYKTMSDAKETTFFTTFFQNS